jgi:hypothetical protein
MTRIAYTLSGAVLGAIAVAVVWWWWTVPPRADARTLAAAAAAVPSAADGLVVVAQPSRAARWLLRRPQAAALLAVAAPEAENSLARLRSTLATLAGEADGPLTVWWRGTDVAVAARVPDGSARALRTLAALEGLPVRSVPTVSNGVALSIASAAALLDGATGARPPFGGPDRLTAIVRVGPRWWSVRAERDRLDLASGTVPDLPPPEGPSTIVTDDIGRLIGLASPQVSALHGSAALAFGPGGWALTLPRTAVGPGVTRLLSVGGDAPEPTPAGARRWRGVLGELWVLPGPGLAVASSASMLASLPPAPFAGESGMVRGSELSTACIRAADAVDALWVLQSRAAAMRRAAPAVAALRLARWRIVPDGGVVRLEW